MVERALTCTLCGIPSSPQTWQGAPVCDMCFKAVNILSAMALEGNNEANKLLQVARKKVTPDKDKAIGQSIIEYASHAWGDPS